MDWQVQLISLYLYICKQYKGELSMITLRMSNNNKFNFSDEEAITIYLFGIIDGHKTIKNIFEYADRHLRNWFPNLPHYEAFVYRLNKIAEIFPALLEQLQREEKKSNNLSALLIDSFPVIMAQQGRRFKAKVAKEIASSGYCPTKKLYFHGVKIHIAGRYNSGSLPTPEYISMHGAADHDGKIFDQMRPVMCGETVFGDKAYIRPDAKQAAQEYSLKVLTPIKKEKGQQYLDTADRWLSKAVSSVRQPIESLFSWIEQKTGIECASRVRSYNGLLTHVFGRLTAALFYWNKLRVV